MARRERHGIPTAESLPQAQRQIIEPLLDLVARMTGVTLPKLPVDESYLEVALTAFLGGGAVLADVIVKANELQLAIEELQESHDKLQKRVNALTQRIQED